MIDWAEVVNRHTGMVWKTAYRVLGNRADAFDCLQDTFLAAVQFSQRQEVRDWPALLQHLAAARAIDRLRRRTSEAKHRDGLADVSNIPARDPGPAKQAEDAELVERLRGALAKLPDHQAEAYYLRCVVGLSYEQIAVQLGIQPGTVGSLLHRARDRLRVMFDPCMQPSNREANDE